VLDEERTASIDRGDGTLGKAIGLHGGDEVRDKLVQTSGLMRACVSGSAMTCTYRSPSETKNRMPLRCWGSARMRLENSRCASAAARLRWIVAGTM
jgi:hypothetical protein